MPRAGAPATHREEDTNVIIHEIPGYIQVSYDEAKDYVLFDWTDFTVTLDQIKAIHEKALAAAQQKHCSYYVAETSKVKTVLRPEVVAWFGEWFPKMVAGNIRTIVTVVPSSALANLSTRSWQSEVVGTITMRNTASLKEAEAFVQEMKAAKTK